MSTGSGGDEENQVGVEMEEDPPSTEKEDECAIPRTRTTTTETHTSSSTTTLDYEDNNADDDDEEPAGLHHRQQQTRTTVTAAAPRQRSNTSTSTSSLYIDDEEILSRLQPPMSKTERLRDWFLRKLDKPVFQGLGIVVLVLVIADGAFFFFLLMGWHALCDEPSRMDCEPRNWWYNWSIQVLNVLFTYMAVISMPWRCANFFHLTGAACPRRSNHIGYNLYGLEDPELWFHIAVPRRLGITVILILNCIFQFINQGTRIGFYHFDSQDSSPGNIWTNVFFAASFACAAIAGVWMLWEAAQLRKLHPGKFGPGPMEAVRLFYHTHIVKDKEEQAHPAHHYVDPTRDPNHVALIGDDRDRAGMRLWAL